MQEVYWVPLVYVSKLKKYQNTHSKKPKPKHNKNTPKTPQVPQFCTNSEQFSPYLTELIS